MDDLYIYLLNFVAGMGLGFFYFGGLWLTVRRLAARDQPFLWLGLSFLTRLGLTLAGFYLVAGGHWQRLIVSVAGFLLARLVLTYGLGRAKQQGV
jgi:F1F0 ATPase subunit 2